MCEQMYTLKKCLKVGAAEARHDAAAAWSGVTGRALLPAVAADSQHARRLGVARHEPQLLQRVARQRPEAVRAVEPPQADGAHAAEVEVAVVCHAHPQQAVCRHRQAATAPNLTVRTLIHYTTLYMYSNSIHYWSSSMATAKTVSHLNNGRVRTPPRFDNGAKSTQISNFNSSYSKFVWHWIMCGGLIA